MSYDSCQSEELKLARKLIPDKEYSKKPLTHCINAHKGTLTLITQKKMDKILVSGVWKNLMNRQIDLSR